MLVALPATAVTLDAIPATVVILLDMSASVSISDTIAVVPNVFKSDTASAVPSLPISVALPATAPMSVASAATALIIAPNSVGIAIKMGVSIDPFLMAVAVGASCAFLTPIGHQCNALILGPGGYKFSDYW